MLDKTEEHANNCKEPLGFPKSIENRPGLSSIVYRIGTYSDFRELLLRSLNRSIVLSAWTYREPDDPGIALVEGASIVCDILTFYQELYANETKLRTAKWRQSISDLVRLIGYRLSPGVAGRATFALELRGSEPVVINAGFPFKADIEGLEKPVEFESEEEAIAYPWLSKFHLYRPTETAKITNKVKEFYVYWSDPNSDPVTIKEGDRLLIGNRAPNDTNDSANPAKLLNAEIIVVDKIRQLPGRSLFSIKGNLMQQNGNNQEVIGYKLGRSFRHFGHNAPQTIMVTKGATITPEKISYVRWICKDTTGNSPKPIETRVLDPILYASHFPLDSSVDDISPGTTFLIQNSPKPVPNKGMAISKLKSNIGVEDYKLTQELQTFVGTVKETRSISMTWGAVTGETSLVVMEKQLETESFDAIDIRYIEFHEGISPVFRLRAKENETLQPNGKSLNFYGTDEEAKVLKNRKLLLVSPTKLPFAANVDNAELISALNSVPTLHRITLDKDVEYTQYPNEKPTVTIYGNLIDTNQGKTEKKAILGNGDSRQIYQTFKLPKSPLTYRIVSGETPPEVPQLEIYINDQLWTRVTSFFNRGFGEKIYVVREDANGDSWVQFGDGKTGGARLPSGLKNVVAIYRTGVGAYGHLKAETTVQAGDRIENLDKIQLLDVVTGGSSPEDGENARLAAPGKIQSLGRLVSIQDFESEVQSIPGVSKASAKWGLDNNIPVTIVRILMETGREQEFKDMGIILKEYDRMRGMQRFPITVRQSIIEYARISLEYGYDSTFHKEQIEKAIKEVLGVVGENDINASSGLFGIRHRKFGEREYVTRIEGAIQNIPGIVYVRVTSAMTLSRLNILLRPTKSLSRLNIPSKNLQPVITCGEDNILALHTKDLQMKGSKVELLERR